MPGPDVVGSVVSVNAGEPRIVQWADREVRTGIWKSPVDRRVRASGVNLDGDGQADLRVHGGADKAVYAYRAEDYEWWSAEVGEPVGPATFGENLTVRGVDLAGAVVGEVWAIATARFVVTQPRLPCFKLGIRMGDASFVRQFEEAGRYGTYLRIDQPGEVGAGDEIVRVARPDHDLTAYGIAAIHKSRDRAGIERLTTVPGVPESWREWAEQRLERSA